MIDRRTFLALSAALPLAPRLNRQGSAEMSVEPIDLVDSENVSIIGISPDGTRLVGVSGSDRICFYNIESGEQISISEALPDIVPMDRNSLQWNPSGSKVAFSIQSWIRLIDSDIFVVDVETGEVTNLTPEGVANETDSIMNVDFTNLDMYPVWLDDETILFVRHIWSSGQDVSRSLVTINLDGGDIENWSPLLMPDLRFVMGPMRLVSDDTVIFAADSPDNRIFLYSATKGEGPTKIDLGEIQSFQLLDANESHSIILDPVSRETFVIPNDDPAAGVPAREFFPLEVGGNVYGPPALGPTPGSFAAIGGNSDRKVFVYEEGEEPRVVANLAGETGPIQHFIWQENAILVATKSAAWLVTDF